MYKNYNGIFILYDWEKELVEYKIRDEIETKELAIINPSKFYMADGIRFKENVPTNLSSF